MKKIELNNWSVVCKPDPYVPPELLKSYLHGEVYNHPKFEDGKEITTSRIKKVEVNKATTKSGTEYFLLDVDPEYEKLFPDALKRLSS